MLRSLAAKYSTLELFSQNFILEVRHFITFGFWQKATV